MAAMSAKRKNIAVLCAGTDIYCKTRILNRICDRLSELNGNTAIFQSFPSHNFDTPAANELHNRWENHIFDIINPEKFDGIIVLTSSFERCGGEEKAVVKRARAAGVPVVSLDGAIDGCYNIIQDDGKAVENITTHIAKIHGRRKFLYIDGTEDASVASQRRRSFLKAVRENNLEALPILNGGFWGGGAAKALRTYIDSGAPMPDAVICCNDAMALGVLKYFEETKVNVPRQVIVAGYDNVFESAFSNPSLLTAGLEPKVLADAAADKIIAIAGGLSPAYGTTVLEPIVIPRRSCGCTSADCEPSDIIGRLSDTLSVISQREMNTPALAGIIEDLNGVASIDEAVAMIESCFYKTWLNEMDLCLCEDYYLKYTNDNDIDTKTCSEPTPYTETMELAARLRNKKHCKSRHFALSDMLPDFYDAMDEFGQLMFITLHYRARTIGYIALQYRPEITHDHLYPLMQFLTNVSSALENVRIRSQMMIIAEKMEYLYIHDPLTGLLNRRGFYQQAAKLCKELAGTGSITVFSFDIDDLKEVNDNYGHSEGDHIIIILAGALAAASHNGEICTRFGGDEFVVMGRQLDSNYEADYIKRVANRIDEYNAGGMHPYKLNYSCGAYSAAVEAGTGPDEFLRAADEKMYNEKRSHKHFRNTSRNR